MEIGLYPDFAWQFWVAGAGAALAALLVVTGWWRSDALGRARWVRNATVGLSGLGAALFCLALCAPGFKSRDASRPGFSVVALLDVSDSVMRARDGWPGLRASIAKTLRRAFASQRQGAAPARVITFRSQASAFGSAVALRSIGDAVAKLAPSSFASGEGTNLAVGLDRSGEEIDRAGGSGAVILFSDGNETEGDAVQAAARLGRKGIPVYVVPVTGGSPEVGIMEANLPANADAGTETYVRGMALNAGQRTVRAELTFKPQVLAAGNRPLSAVTSEISLEPGVWNRYRFPVTFEKPGLQFVDIALSDKTGPPNTRRLFTFVESPPRLLAVGADLWTAAFPPGSALITRKLPRDVSAQEVRDHYDGIVIDGVPARDFAPGVLQAVSETVKTGAAGLFLMNGRHQGPPRDATNLMSYNGTPIEPLLPLESRPRPKEEDAPPRHVVILIDVSGSMGGAPLELEQQIATYVIEKLLRPKDSLDVCAFTTEAREMEPPNVPMNDAGKQHATNFIKSLNPCCGTDPTPCLRKLVDRNMPNCGMIFLSDGFFDKPSVHRPDCRTAAFGIGRNSFSPFDPIRELADPIPAPIGFDPSRIRIPYFEKRPVDQFYEPGAYRALPMMHLINRGPTLPMPPMPLDGSATTFPKSDTELIAVRPKLTDPVLAFKDANAGQVAEFTSSIPRAWLKSSEGRQAIRQWIARILPMSELRRYQVQVTPHRADLELEISGAPRGGHIPDVRRLSVELEEGGSSMGAIPMRPDDVVRGVFHGSLPLSTGSDSKTVTLVLRESGAEALARPQRLQAVLPPAGAGPARLTREVYTYGINEDLLRRVAGAGGGAYDDLKGVGGLDAGRESEGVRLIWPEVAAAACVCYLLAVLLRRLDI